MMFIVKLEIIVNGIIKLSVDWKVQIYVTSSTAKNDLNKLQSF